MTRRQPKICVYCSTDGAETRDHVPPIGVFPKPRTADLITVPCCRKCNESFSRDDVRFRTYVSAALGVDPGPGERLWAQLVEPGLAKDAALCRELLSRGELVIRTDSAGALASAREELLWDSDVHDRVVARIVRGLAFHHLDRRVPARCAIRVHWFGANPPTLPSAPLPWAQAQSAAGQFRYWFLADTRVFPASAWVLSFYNRHWAGAQIVPTDTQQDH